jgi:hypothetical protein
MNRSIYGVPIVKTPEQVQQENELMAGMAGLPDSDITQELYNTKQPTGGMVGNVYVGQSPLQSLNASVRQGMGGYQMGKAAQMKQEMVKRLRTNFAGGQQGYGAQKTPQAPVPFSGEWDGY